jgi:hypothetical protein
MASDPPTHDLPLVEALRRHGEGDRSPDVLAALNHAAWDAFHAPWEAPSLEPTMAEEPEPDFLEPLPIGVARVTEAMLADWVEREGYTCFQGKGRGILIDFRYSLKSCRRVMFRASLSGRDEDILTVQITSDRRVPPEDFVRALRCCNVWNQEYRWPRALVEQDYQDTDAQDDPPPDPAEVEAREETHPARLRLDFQVPLYKGIHPEGLDTILTAVLRTGWDFWIQAHEKWGL